MGDNFGRRINKSCYLERLIHKIVVHVEADFKCVYMYRGNSRCGALLAYNTFICVVLIVSVILNRI